jgi:hypothetical protein
MASELQAATANMVKSILLPIRAQLPNYLYEAEPFLGSKYFTSYLDQD